MHPGIKTRRNFCLKKINLRIIRDTWGTTEKAQCVLYMEVPLYCIVSVCNSCRTWCSSESKEEDIWTGSGMPRVVLYVHLPIDIHSGNVIRSRYVNLLIQGRSPGEQWLCCRVQGRATHNYSGCGQSSNSDLCWYQMNKSCLYMSPESFCCVTMCHRRVNIWLAHR